MKTFPRRPALALNTLTFASLAALATLASVGVSPSYASSHREAPFITTQPKVDGTDLYLFNSYETDRAD